MCGGDIYFSALKEATASKINTSSYLVRFFFFYLWICLSVSLFLICFTSQAGHQLSSSQWKSHFLLSAVTEHREPQGSQASWQAFFGVAGARLAPGPGFGLPHHLITLKPWIFRAVHFNVCHKCQSPASNYSTRTSNCSEMFYEHSIRERIYILCNHTEFLSNSCFPAKKTPPPSQHKIEIFPLCSPHLTILSLIVLIRKSY